MPRPAVGKSEQDDLQVYNNRLAGFRLSFASAIFPVVISLPSNQISIVSSLSVLRSLEKRWSPLSAIFNCS